MTKSEKREIKIVLFLGYAAIFGILYSVDAPAGLYGCAFLFTLSGLFT